MFRYYAKFQPQLIGHIFFTETTFDKKCITNSSV